MHTGIPSTTLAPHHHTAGFEGGGDRLCTSACPAHTLPARHTLSKTALTRHHWQQFQSDRWGRGGGTVHSMLGTTLTPRFVISLVTKHTHRQDRSQTARQHLPGTTDSRSNQTVARSPTASRGNDRGSQGEYVDLVSDWTGAICMHKQGSMTDLR